MKDRDLLFHPADEANIYEFEESSTLTGRPTDLALRKVSTPGDPPPDEFLICCPTYSSLTTGGDKHATAQDAYRGRLGSAHRKNQSRQVHALSWRRRLCRSDSTGGKYCE